ncbi:epoxide hydrolase family protein [Amycolatopsis sacchari]|uniref:Pimeloyl-ACP methyl ester carboxylesterase n=1 Tax=Amycolatopsis sacchari TaxID=115433 RepID=A0A1I3PQP4_9PSEU|nr:epoxide hydrolase family protein [Amycolatopsis sacchari]SFJ23812.1 Pimeloyl-ACP methyl ester carboxylesterase [Amycolatopsis sacchari]
MNEPLTPFRIDVPQEQLDDLRERLRRTRWPDPEPVADWSQGVPLSYVRDLCRYWAEEYDWRATEARLNALPQYVTEIDGVRVHFAHVRSPHPDALPLVLTNGWPGSLTEYLKVVEPLTNPPDPADAFHLVLPTLPGYGFSGKPTTTGWGVQRIARAWAELMARLGYARYGAAGSDWGTSVTTSLGQQDAARLAGIHVIPPIAAPDPATFDDLTDDERATLEALEHAGEHESGYSAEQSTKPQTLGYGLVDSPAALCAWIVEKFRSWTERPDLLTRDELLDNVMLYWLPGTGASSARLYWESFRQVSEWFTRTNDDTIDVPTGCSVFPREVPRPSRRWAARRYTDIRWWHEPPRGGHFAALEEPELFAEELRSFFRLVR